MYSMKMSEVLSYQEHYHRTDFNESSKDGRAHTSRAHAARLDDELQVLQRRIGQDWMASGKIIKEFHDEQLWKVIGYDSFKAWVEQRCGHAVDYAYKAMRISSELSDLPPEKVQKLTLDNASKIVKLPKSQRTDEVLEMASSMAPKEFSKRIEEEHPAVFTDEGQETLSFRVKRSLAAVMRDAIDTATQMEAEKHSDAKPGCDCRRCQGLSTKEVGLERIFSDFVTSEAVMRWAARRIAG
jgi:hypothetical protein